MRLTPPFSLQRGAHIQYGVANFRLVSTVTCQPRIDMLNVMQYKNESSCNDWTYT